MQVCVRFSGRDSGEVMSNGRQRAFFWRSCLPVAAAFQYYSPPLAASDFKQRIGAFTLSLFIPGTSQALTGTEDGDAVVWGEQGVCAEIGTKASDRKAIKLMRLHNSAITALTSVSDFVVTGGAEGYVRLFDPMLRLVAWFEHAHAGPVRSISFSCTNTSHSKVAASDSNMFICPDFLIGTASGAIVRMTASEFNTGEADKRNGVVLVHGTLRDIVTIAAHPMQPQFLAVAASGHMQLWDASSHTLLMAPAPPAKAALQPTCAEYSADGAILVIGAQDGGVAVLSAGSLAESVRVKQTRSAICFVAISSRGAHIAAATADGHILLTFLVPYKHAHRWEYIGRAKVHHSDIVALRFGEAPSGETRCFSLDAVGRLAEFDLEASSLEAGVVVHALTAVAPAAPTAMTFAPVLTYFTRGVTDTQLLLAGGQQRLRALNPDANAATATLRMQACAAPVVQFLPFQPAGHDSTFVAYRCALLLAAAWVCARKDMLFASLQHRGASRSRRHLTCVHRLCQWCFVCSAAHQTAGIMLWPSDGHPSSMASVMAHPTIIKSMTVSCDGMRMLTVDNSGHIKQWTLDCGALEEAVAQALALDDKWPLAVQDEIDVQEAEQCVQPQCTEELGHHLVLAFHGPCTCALTLRLDHEQLCPCS